MSSALERLLPLEGCFNFRDLGGYRGEEGRTVRWRMLFRADGLHRLTAADRAELQTLGLRTVIDLRTSGEVNDRGRIETDHEVDYHHLPMIDVLPPSEGFEEWVKPAYVAGQYREMLGSDTAAIGRALGLLAEGDRYPAAYHCMAGKDRTGILTALVLGLLGVSEDDIVADYALSRDGMQRMLAWLRTEYPERVESIDKSSAAMVAAEPAAMAAFLAEFKADWGSFDAYATALGLDGIGEKLRANLLS